MNKILLRITIIVSVIFISHNVFAQRTMPNEKMFSISTGYNYDGYGVSASFGGYTKSGYWQVGASRDMYRKQLNLENYKLDYYHITVSGYYLTSLFRTRSRSFNLYGGGGIFMGYESIDPFRRLPKTIETNLKNGYFLCGLSAVSEVEIFLTRKFAIIVSQNVPLNFSSKLGFIHFQTKVGFRIMI